MFRSNSRITKKIAKRMFFIYSCLFLVVLIAMVLILFPYLFISAKDEAADTTELLMAEYSDLQNNMYDKLYMLTSLKELSYLLDNYKSYPSEKNFAELSLYLNTFRASNDSILFVMVDDCNGNVFSSINYSKNNISNLIQKDSHYQNLYSKTSAYYSPIYNDLFINKSINTSISSCFLSQKYELNNDTYQITICYSTDAYIRKSNKLMQKGLDSFLVMDRNGQIKYTKDKALDNLVQSNALVNKMTSTNGEIRVAGGYCFYSKVITSGSIIVGYASNLTLLSGLLTRLLLILILYIIPPVLYYLFLIPTNDKFLAPLKDLSDKIMSFSIGQEPPDIIRTGDEIEDLSTVFRDMILKINMQARNISIQEREKAVTYYKLLATQLDPHFVYNTMNIINILARQNRTEDIIEVNTALTRILRERLNTQSTVFCTIEEEINTLKQYNIIMDYRYAKNVHLVYEVDHRLKNKLIPKNILQPLIENAYYHGLTRDDGIIKGNITVMIYPLESNIIIEVSDDGKGIDPDRLNFLKENNFNINQNNIEDSHIGLKNIYERLFFLYNDAFQMDVRSSLGFGTTVVLALPYTKK